VTNEHGIRTTLNMKLEIGLPQEDKKLKNVR
jgi:hypothetical protein